MMEVLKGEFFWGIVVGAVLAALGAYLIVFLQDSSQQKIRKNVIREFSQDTVRNILEIIRNLQEIRDRKAGIQHDFLALLDVELTVFGRNREHTIYLSLETRDKLRKFMNACAIKRAEITNFLAEFYKQNALADQLTASGQAPQGQRVKNDALLILNNANSAADQLFSKYVRANNFLSQLAAK